MTALLIVLVPIVLDSLINTGQAQAAWYNNNWLYRQTETGSPTTTASPLSIGHGTTSGSGNNYFNGQIDDVCVFNYALTTQQVKTLNNGAVSY